jgi:protein required for attachment to host cells
MKTGKRLWVVVADSARARFLVPGYETQGFGPIGPRELSSDAVRGHARDLKSDKPGRSFGSASGGGVRHAIEPKHDYHKLEKRKFMQSLADALDEARGAGAFDELILVVPRRSLGELRLLLSERVKASIKEAVAKDLIADTNEELWMKLAPMIAKVSAEAS